MKNKYRILKIVIVVVLFAFLLDFSLKRFNNKKQILNIKFEQAAPVYFIDEATIESIVKEENKSGKVGDINIQKLEKKINNMPFIDTANVYLNLNGKLIVDIQQKVPTMRINTGSKEYYVDSKGNEFPLSTKFSYPCMLISGKISKNDYKGLNELIKKINEDSFYKKYIIGINLVKNGNYQLLTDDSNFKVELGDLKKINFKLAGFKAFIEKYLIYQDNNRYDIISLKYDNQIVATLKKGYSNKENEIKDIKPANTITAKPVSEASKPISQ